MKKRVIFGILAAFAVCSCQVEEINETAKDSTLEVIKEAKVFTAIIDDTTTPETRTSLDAEGNVLWKQGDQVSIFAGSTVNEQYQVSDASDGKTAASLNKVGDSGFVAGTEIDNNVAFYPYASTAAIAKSAGSYVISDITLPATQTYAEGSFGNGAFPMAAVTGSTGDMNLKFKNVLGGLKLQLKGTASIASISITGNNNEILYGTAEVTVANGSTPSINLTDASAKTVTLDCGGGVALDSETATPFIIALPPITMTGGFTVVVTDTEGKQMEIKTTKSQTITRSSLLKMPAVNYVGETPLASPLKFTSTGATRIVLLKQGTPDAIALEYRIDDGGWTNYPIGTSGDLIYLTDGQELSFRAGAGGNVSFSQSLSKYYHFNIAGSGTVAVSGNIMSLLNKEGGVTIPSSYTFCRLFYDCSSLTTAPELPATTLDVSCYYEMFYGCSSLTTAPKLPATTLANGCYRGMFSRCFSLTTTPELPATSLANGCYREMFRGCSSLTTAPELPVTTLAEGCYHEMFAYCSSLTAVPELPATTLTNNCYEGLFAGCSSLTTAPELPATTLAEGCYGGMFAYCSSLTTAPELPVTTLAEGCYGGMFRGCTSLTAVPELPATTLTNNCYKGLFAGCSSLTTAPELPATTLAEGCYSEMFADCSSLTTAPELPATTLAEGCYSYMFADCSSLTTAPELPATTLVVDCYGGMFYECSNLKYIKALFTTTPSSDYTDVWVSGVSATGTFVKSSSATWNVTGDNGVPSGWTILTQ